MREPLCQLALTTGCTGSCNNNEKAAKAVTIIEITTIIISELGLPPFSVLPPPSPVYRLELEGGSRIGLYELSSGAVPH